MNKILKRLGRMNVIEAENYRGEPCLYITDTIAKTRLTITEARYLAMELTEAANAAAEMDSLRRAS